MMNILIISCVFPPEPVTSAITSEQIAMGLVERGHKVTVITAFPNRPGGKLYSGYTRTWRKVQEHPNGYQLIRVFSFFSTTSTATSRLLENLSFGLRAVIESLWIKPDLVYVNTWPLFALGMVTALCSLRKVPLVINIQDIYPESAIALKKSPETGIIPQLLKDLDRWIAHQAKVLITPSENFADFYRTIRQVPADKIHIVYNWLDEEEIKPFPRLGAFRTMQGISEDTFVVMYAGNIGVNAGVEIIIEVANQLKDLEKVIFVIAGSGTCKNQCEELVKQYNLSNVQFFSPLPKELFSDVQGSADLMILPTRGSGALTSVPSKLIAYMLSGRPVLAAVAENSDTARIIQQAECGVFVPPEEPMAIASEIRHLMQVPEKLKQMGESARFYTQKNFSGKACLPKLINILESLEKKH